MNPSEAITLGSQHQYTIAAMFLIGHLMHAGLQVDAIARSKTNPVTSRWFIVQQNSFRLAARFFVSLMAFLFLWNTPDAVPTILGYLGVTVSENVTAIMTLPMNPPIAGIMGFSVDTLLAYVPWLSNQLPPIEFTQVATRTTETTKSGEVTTEVTVKKTETPATPDN